MITVEEAIKSDKTARTSEDGKRVLGIKGKIPKIVWVVLAAGVVYWIYTETKKSNTGDIQSPHITPPGQPGSAGSHG